MKDKDKQSKKNLNQELSLVRNALENSQRQLDDFGNTGSSETQCKNYAYVVENAPIAVVITDAKGLIEFVNPKFEEVTGYKLHEVVGKNPNFLKSGESQSEDYKDLWDTISTGDQWNGVFHNRRKDGELFWERAVITGIKDSNNEITHYIAIKEDITEIKDARRKLEQERLKIIQQSKMAEIGLLTSGILHEVGNPIAAIHGLVCDIKDLSKLIKDMGLRQLMTKQLDQVIGEVDRITGITMDISEFSYSRHARTELLDINAMINTTCRLIQYDGRWSHIDLRVVLDPDLPPVYGTKDQITQVLINLLSNAAYAVEQVMTRKSSVHISTCFDEEYIYINIKDNGCGIEMSILPKIFENFFTSKGPGEGTGLGLAMCKSLLDSHRGSIDITSQVGVMTNVCVSLPIKYSPKD